MEQPLKTEDLLALLRQVYLDCDNSMRERFKRSLSFQDTILDRWDRAIRLGFAPDASIYNSASVFGEVTVGTATWIGPNALLDGSGGGISIGRFCSISSGVHIYTHDTVMWALTGGKRPRNTKRVDIGDNVYIGSQSIVAPGVSIGSKCVIGANSFVNRDVNEFAIVAGSPAKEIGRVIEQGDSVLLDYFQK
ncbi:acyltransferase [Synechococcus sp. HJ21-Hayes]|uniref:acyltransferase n=1 Tax=unclassified Synechococcus TaxID=2626047 RepID=UPI0020CBDF8E|nr:MULTISPECIES: acyltransferase [unclassified Synechococcus]MCP9830075.1 acyltransferase [Synechococcus sp. JJ3a-Johnson]MCP9852117.1 acyltransferase [Synechococcus sp. HJ21-Hayes]